jgi:hypothetical protein
MNGVKDSMPGRAGGGGGGVGMVGIVGIAAVGGGVVMAGGGGVTGGMELVGGASAVGVVAVTIDPSDIRHLPGGSGIAVPPGGHALSDASTPSRIPRQRRKLIVRRRAISALTYFQT